MDGVHDTLVRKEHDWVIRYSKIIVPKHVIAIKIDQKKIDLTHHTNNILSVKLLVQVHKDARKASEQQIFCALAAADAIASGDANSSSFLLFHIVPTRKESKKHHDRLASRQTLCVGFHHLVLVFQIHVIFQQQQRQQET